MIANDNAGLAMIIDRALYEQDHPDEVRQNRPWENPANPIDTQDPSYATGTPSGVPMNETIALTYAPVWQACSLISGDIAKLAMSLCKRIEDRTCDRLWDSPLTDLVNKRPNDDLEPTKFWRRTVLHYLLYGNAYIWVRRDTSGEPLELIHLLPNRTYPIRHPEDNYNIWYWSGLTTPPWHFPLPAEDVIHLEWLQDVPYEIAGVNTTRAAKNSWALGLAQEAFASRFFKHGGRIGGILELPAAMTRESKENVSGDFRQVYEGNENAFKTVILRDNAKFHQGQFNFNDSQLVQGTEEQARQTARWFNLPPDKLGVEGGSSYNSKHEDNRNYLETTLGIIMRLIEGGLNQRLLRRNQSRSHYFQFDTRELVAPDPPAKMDMALKGFSGNLMTMDESRALIGLPPLQGADGEKFARDFDELIEPAEPQTGNVDGQVDPQQESNNDQRFAEMRVMLPVLDRCTKLNNRSLDRVRDFMLHGAADYRPVAQRYLGNDETLDAFLEGLRSCIASGGDVQGRIRSLIENWEHKYATTGTTNAA